MGIVERANRTIRERININIFNNNTNEFIKDIRMLEYSNNNSYHSNLELAPNDLDKDMMNRNIEDDKQFNRIIRKKYYNFKIGDKVRVREKYEQFEKKTKGMLIVDSWVPVDDLNVDEIVKKGFNAVKFR